jgi:hypothetical protein
MRSSPAPTTFLFGILLVILLGLLVASRVFAQMPRGKDLLYQKDLINGVHLDCDRNLGSHQIRVSVRVKMPKYPLGMPSGSFSVFSKWFHSFYEPVIGLVTVEVGKFDEEKSFMDSYGLREYFGTMTFSGYASRAAVSFRDRISLVTVRDIPAKLFNENGQVISPEVTEELFEGAFGEAYLKTTGSVFGDKESMKKALNDYLRVDVKPDSNQEFFKLLDGNPWANLRELPLYFNYRQCRFY